MNKHILVLLIILLATVTLGSDNFKENIREDRKLNPAGNDYFFISIEQNKEVIPIKNHEVTIKRREFDINIIFNKKRAINKRVLVNFCYNDHFFKGLSQGKSLEEILYFVHPGSKGKAAAHAYRRGGMTVPVYKFNSEKHIVIHDYSNHAFFFENNEDHNFSEVVEENNRLICRRTVANYYDGHLIPIEQIKSNTIYIAVLYMQEDGSKMTDEQWEYLKLNFK